MSSALKQSALIWAKSADTEAHLTAEKRCWLVFRPDRPPAGRPANNQPTFGSQTIKAQLMMRTQLECNLKEQSTFASIKGAS